MSTDLHVKLNNKVSTKLFAKGCAWAIAELCQDNVGTINLQETRGGVMRPFCSEWITSPFYGLVSIQNHHEVEIMVTRNADILTTYLPSNDYELAPEDLEIEAEIAIRGWSLPRDPLKWVIAASCAISFARISSSKIIDESCNWNNIREVTISNFIRNIQVQNSTLLNEARMMLSAYKHSDREMK